MKKWMKKNLLILVAILGVTAFLGQQIQASKQSQQYYGVILPTHYSDLYDSFNHYVGPGLRIDNNYGTNGTFTTTTYKYVVPQGSYTARHTEWTYNGAWLL